MPDENGYKGTREEMERAIRRLHALGYVILLAAVLLALGGGAAVAFILSTGTALPFGLTWGLVSVLLLLVPGALVFGRDHLKRRDRTGLSDEPRADNG